MLITVPQHLSTLLRSHLRPSDVNRVSEKGYPCAEGATRGNNLYCLLPAISRWLLRTKPSTLSEHSQISNGIILCLNCEAKSCADVYFLHNTSADLVRNARVLRTKTSKHIQLWNFLSPMLLVANLANTKLCKKPLKNN